MTTQEVLARPTPPRHPVRRALLAAVVLAGAGWAVVDRLGDDDRADPPAAAPSSPGPSGTVEEPLSVPPPQWVRYPNPLEGRWVASGSAGRVTLVIKNSRLALWSGSDRSPARVPLGFRTITVWGGRVVVLPTNDVGEVATYHWRIRADRLAFGVVEDAATAALGLETFRFHRV